MFESDVLPTAVTKARGRGKKERAGEYEGAR